VPLLPHIEPTFSSILRPEDPDLQDPDLDLLWVVGGMAWEYWLEDGVK
jgi:hypothetical protein